MAPEPWQNLAIWIAGGVFALAGALVYARLSEAWPSSGGAFIYLRNCYGEWVASLLLAADVLLARPAAVGALATGLGLIWELDAERTLRLAIFTLGVLTAGQLVSRRTTGGMQVALTVLQMAPLLVIAAAGLALPEASPRSSSSEQPALWASGFLAVLWAYDGWYNITILGGEVSRPQRNLRRSLVGGVLLVTTIYVSLNALLLARIPREEIVEAGLPFALLLKGWDVSSLGLLLRLGLSLALLATLNGTLACGPSMLAASGMAGTGSSSPRLSLLLFSGWCLMMLLIFAALPSRFVLFDRLSEYTAVVVAALSGLTVSCLFHLPRHGYTYGLGTSFAAVIFLAMDAALVLLLAYERPQLALAGILSVLLAGSLLHALRWSRSRKRPGQEA